MKLDEMIRRALFRLRGRVLNFKPRSNVKGTVLISYVTLPFFRSSSDPLLGHTNYWESKEMVEIFVERGYEVDLIDTTNHTFTPKKSYDFFIDNGSNMDRIAPLLNHDCIKIFHSTTSHWQFQNEAEKKRAIRVKESLGVLLPLDRELASLRAIEISDVVTMLGNAQTESTYAFAGKQITRIPISTTHSYETPEHKNFDGARKNFIWFGGAGALHKGLDLVLEAFSQMPDLHLTVCGKVSPQDKFADVYRKEMYETQNIKTVGWIDPGSEEFKMLYKASVALVYPSCAEGQAGSVVLSMHAGLIPIVSRESGVDVEPFGIVLPENSVEAVIAAVKKITNESSETLRERAVGAWSYARTHHTRETFSKAYGEFVDTLTKKYA